MSTQSVLAKLYEDIIVGTFSFGAKLGEESLVKRYATKRHILREAFGQLEEIGLVERIPNRGVYVREPLPTEVRELFEMRELLEIQAVNVMPLPVPTSITDEMQAIQDQHTAAVKSANYRAVLQLNTKFHQVQYSACKNAILEDAIQSYAKRTHLISSMKFGDPKLMENVVAQHLNIIEAMKNSDRAALADAIRSHFDLARIDQYRHQYCIRHSDALEVAR